MSHAVQEIVQLFTLTQENYSHIMQKIAQLLTLKQEILELFKTKECKVQSLGNVHSQVGKLQHFTLLR
jgi:hypothetical protein